MKDRQPVKIRLYGIDTPERKQAFSRKATEQIKELVAHDQVRPAAQQIVIYRQENRASTLIAVL